MSLTYLTHATEGYNALKVYSGDRICSSNLALKVASPSILYKVACLALPKEAFHFHSYPLFFIADYYPEVHFHVPTPLLLNLFVGN